MNISILADISDVMKSTHPVFGIPIGLCLLLFVLFKVFNSNQNTGNKTKPGELEAKARELEREAKRLQDEVVQSMRETGLKERLDIVNPKPDYEISEKMPLKEQLLSDLRKEAALGMMTKQEYEAKRKKIFDMP